MADRSAMTLFLNLPEQRPPAVLTTDRHALIQCADCGGTGEGDLRWPDHVDPCWTCGGGGCVLRAVGDG